MAANCCPTCGRRYAKPKAPTGPTDPALMTISQLYEYHAKRAPLEDARFGLRVLADPELIFDWAELVSDIEQGRIDRAGGYRRLSALQDRWRGIRLAAEREERRQDIERAKRWAWTLTLPAPKGRVPRALAS